MGRKCATKREEIIESKGTKVAEEDAVAVIFSMNEIKQQMLYYS